MNMDKKIELLAPGGDVNSIKAAIIAGADAVYCGLSKFNARNRAENIEFDDLVGITYLAHKYDCEVFLTINIIITQSEITSLTRLLDRLVNTAIDAVIVQDLGLFYVLEKYYPGLVVHASTQMTIHNKGQVEVAKILGANRVNLCRELNVKEIADLASYGHARDVSTEVFVHGSNCIGFSGLCYFSSVRGGNSGNRGRCSQPCRDHYVTTPQGRNFPLNLKDNSAFFDIKDLIEAGVDSFKIEGRIKKYHYVYTVIKTWRKQLDNFALTGVIGTDNSDLYRVFNRNFSNTFLKGEIHKDMFIDNPRDNSALHRAQSYGEVNIENIDRAKRDLYDEKTAIITNATKKIGKLSIKKLPLIVHFIGSVGEKLQVTVEGEGISFSLYSERELNLAGKVTTTKNDQGCFSPENIEKYFKYLADTAFVINTVATDNLDSGLFLPFRELRDLGKQMFATLNDEREFQNPIQLPKVLRQSAPDKTCIYVLLSSLEQIASLKGVDAHLYYQLPSTLKGRVDEFVEIFSTTEIVPYFPSLLIGEHFQAAKLFLQKLQPQCIVTNNLGIGRLAQELEIDWIAGPYINVANHYSMRALQEKLGCSGAFISSELSAMQIRALHGPENFSLHYSLYNPLLLFSTRQCLIQPVLGCDKDVMDEKCLENCHKRARIETPTKGSLIIQKEQGHFHSLYNDHNFLNLDIIEDMPTKFSRFMVDFREIETKTQIKIDLKTFVDLVGKCVAGNNEAKALIEKSVSPTTKKQYILGV